MITSLAYTWAKSTDSKSSAAALGANEAAGWQGFLNNHDVGARPRPLRIRRGPPRGGELRLEPALRQGRAIRRRRLRIEERASSAAGRSTGSTSGRAASRSPYSPPTWEACSTPSAPTGRTSWATSTPVAARSTSGSTRAPSPSRRWAPSATPAAASCAGPGSNSLDLGFFKNFTLPRNATLQFRRRGLQRVQPPAISSDVSQNITSRELRRRHIRAGWSHRPTGSEADLLMTRPGAALTGPGSLAGSLWGTRRAGHLSFCGTTSAL